MATVPAFKAADVIAVPGFFATFQTAPGESPSYAGHIAGFLAPMYVLHALWRVVTQAWEAFRQEHPGGFQVWRMKGLTHHFSPPGSTKPVVVPLTQAQRQAVAAKASEYSAKGYGWWRLLFHGADYALGWAAHYLWGRDGEVYLARRLLSDQTRWPLCHEVWARAYWEVLGYKFGGLDWWKVTPDTMQRHMKAHPEEWELIYEQTPAAAA